MAAFSVFFLLFSVLYSDVNGETSTEEENVSTNGLYHFLHKTYLFISTINVYRTLCECHLFMSCGVRHIFPSNESEYFVYFLTTGVTSEKNPKKPATVSMLHS